MEKKKILVIEDDSVLQKTLLEFIADKGFDVIGALDGEEGVDKAFKENPDLILLDIILPKKNGYEVIEAVKAEDKTKNIPIVLLTNLGSLHDVEKALNLGATTYLVKADYKLEDVVSKIRDILNVSR